ncbi:MAG TPA: hypothetical protein VFD32_22835 [Dehalococcoidia bacterium]|nr:hypothetical protein [Dehalococcoidia bacterium]
MGRSLEIVLAVLPIASFGQLACAPQRFSGAVLPGNDTRTQATAAATTVQQGILPVVQAPTNGTPMPYIGQPGDSVTATGSISILFADPVPDPVTGNRQPGYVVYFLTPDDPRLPRFRLIVDSLQPVLSQAVTARLRQLPFQAQVTGTLLDPIPPPRPGDDVRLRITSIIAV